MEVTRETTGYEAILEIADTGEKKQQRPQTFGNRNHIAVRFDLVY